ncbi:hypothetical protein Xets_03806 [Xenorhabdus sp. TS4]|nr:hypothetical protein [Xenorhabdus sp. TS4]
MAQAQALGVHDPVQHRPARITAKTVVEIFRWRDHHRGRFLLMERAQHGHVFAAFKKLPPLLLDDGD